MLARLTLSLFISLAVGVFVTLAFVRQSHLGRRYFLYHGLGAVAFVGMAYWLLRDPSLPDSFGLGVLAFMLFGVGFSVSAVRFPLISIFFYVATVVAGVALLYLECSSRQGGLAVPLLFVNAVLSALLLGFSLMAMLLGHWYLVQPKLSIDELSRLCLVFIGLVVIRFLFGTFMLWPLAGGKTELEVYRYFFGGHPGIFVLMRWVWGLAGPLALCYLIWGTVKIRSTQSATGILYVAVLAVLTGETLSQYLSLFYGITV